MVVTCLVKQVNPPMAVMSIQHIITNNLFNDPSTEDTPWWRKIDVGIEVRIKSKIDRIDLNVFTKIKV